MLKWECGQFCNDCNKCCRLSTFYMCCSSTGYFSCKIYRSKIAQVFRRVNFTSILNKLQYHIKVNGQLHVPVNLNPVNDPSVYIREANGRDPEPTWAF